MKKPLGYWCYFKGNQKEMIKYIFCIVLCIIILGVSKIILTSQQEELKSDFSDYYFMTRIEFKEWNDEASKEVTQITDLNEVEGVFPYEVWSTNCNMLFASLDEYTYFVDTDAIALLVKRMDPSFDMQKMPKKDSGGAIVSDKVASSKRYEEGQLIDAGSKAHMEATYHHSGYSNFVPSTIRKESIHYMVIPAIGKEDELGHHINEIIGDDAEIWDLKRMEELSGYMYGDVDENFGIIMMAITLMTSVTVGGLTYLHYKGRRDEIQLLSDLGYSNKWVIGRMTKEIIITTLLAAGIAFGMLFIFCIIMNQVMNEPNGYAFFKIDDHVLLLVINITLFMMCFSIIPTWMMIGQKQQSQ